MQSPVLSSARAVGYLHHVGWWSIPWVKRLPIRALQPGGSSASQRCSGGLHGSVWQGLANGPSSQGQYPLEGPFLGCFSQGNLAKVNEIVLFHHFRIFCCFNPASLGNSSLLRLVILTRFTWPFQSTSLGCSESCFCKGPRAFPTVSFSPSDGEYPSSCISQNPIPPIGS